MFLLASGARAQVPEGVFSIANKDKQPQNEVLSNPNVDGITIRQDWAKLEPSEGNFDFSYLDSAVNASAAAGKQVLLRIGTQVGKPAWVTTAVKNAKGKFFNFTQSGVQMSIPVFWDPTYLAKKKAMIAALGKHFTKNSAVTIVCCSFANAVSEDWNVPHTPDYVTTWLSLGYTTGKMLDAGEQIIDATMAAFPNQYVNMAISGDGHLNNGLNLDPTATYLAAAVIDYANKTWSNRLVVQINSLSTFIPGAPATADSAWNLLWNSQPNVAAQMVYQCVNDPTYRANGGKKIDPGTALSLSVDNGLEYNLKYIEIYQIDAVNLTTVISSAHRSLTN
ncbi:MAG: beta-galactosidase [Chthoniobacterales bacterium]